MAGPTRSRRPRPLSIAIRTSGIGCGRSKTPADTAIDARSRPATPQQGNHNTGGRGMSDLDLVMGREPKPRQYVYLLFNSEVIVKAQRADWPKLRELVEKLGEAVFDDVEDNNCFEMYDLKTFDE